jgi:hypothetical protein
LNLSLLPATIIYAVSFFSLSSFLTTFFASWLMLLHCAPKTFTKRNSFVPAAIRTVASYILGRIEEFMTQCPGPNAANNVSPEIGGSSGRIRNSIFCGGLCPNSFY